MERRFNQAKMPNDPQRTSILGAAQSTPKLMRRSLNPQRPSSVRSLGYEPATRGKSIERGQNKSLKYEATKQSANGEQYTRLLTRRKQYSQNKVPTLALDEVELSTSTPNIPEQEDRPTGGLVPQTRYPAKREAHSSSTSPLYSLSSKESNQSPVITRKDFNVNTQRPLSASPSKLTVTHSGVITRSRPRQINSAGSVDSMGPLRGVSNYSPGKFGFLTSNYSPVARSPLCTSSDGAALPLMPGNMHSISPAALSPSSAQSSNAMSPSSLVQQRSTESHESSVSMPSATSSGSGGLLLMLGKRKSGRFGSREMTRSAENPPVMEATENDSLRHEARPVQRRSSYEMATGKIEQPQRKQKSSSWKQAYKALKEKRNALFGKTYKSAEETNELGDPVYHLLRCAAIPDHQPATCKCICHMQDFGSNMNILEMSAPINVLFSPTNKTRPPGQPHPHSKHRIAESKLPASLPILYPDEENSPVPEPNWYPQESNTKKSYFSFPNILHRKHRLSGRHSQSASRAEEPETRTFDSPQRTARPVRPQSKNPVFTFD
ncbi:hypothetical protein FGIG_01682 [Fasciola gigantica]|uniref:Uncharacterized protein n=1 Tax=Fasciola gigantica TaxID=46835 RepID=A0A504YU82_FASGI|nr:hypothetical protein FGIG_01682 [Fasciola gigantica]